MGVQMRWCAYTITIGFHIENSHVYTLISMKWKLIANGDLTI